MPSFSRQSGAATAPGDEPTVATGPVRPHTSGVPAPTRTDETTVSGPAPAHRAAEDRPTVVAPTVTGPKPRASLLATLGLLTGAAAVLLVLSGPLAGYAVGLGVLALVLSLAGISATGRRHVAGKTDALIGMVLALGAIVLGVLALTGSLDWLGTDVDNVSRLRNWLDATFINRF